MTYVQTQQQYQQRTRQRTNFQIQDDRREIHESDIVDGDDVVEEEQEQEQDPDRSQEEEEEDEDNAGSSVSDSSSDGEMDDATHEDIQKFQQSFTQLEGRFRLIKRIGEGTFSTVYKAEDLQYDQYHNDWDIDDKYPDHRRPISNHSEVSEPWLSKWQSKARTNAATRKQPKYVAIKKIYVTSSPLRIYNELDLLNDLRGCHSVCPLITAFRSTDQVVAVLPYFRHTDFREYFRKMTVADMRIYFRSLFTALAAVHEQRIIHRDIKPTNFLYDPEKQRGVLVDFGLAEREGTESKPCLCSTSSEVRKHRIRNSIAATAGPAIGYPRADQRPSRRANRAGTRGFRAPEVLYKCTDQTCAIDIWSAGVILLTILSRRFPFFNSADDIEAMIEISTIFGSKKMKSSALLHGASFETTIPTIGPSGFTFEKIITWSTCRTDPKNGEGSLSEDEKAAVEFLERCLDLDPGRRITAEEALQHSFLAEEEGEEEEDEEGQGEEDEGMEQMDDVREEEDEEDELHML